MKFIHIIMILLIEGFVGLSYQMLYMKQLSPWLGNNVVVSSWIIGTFLIALAIGYKKGGEYKKDVNKKISYNFLLASIISGFGLSFLFIDNFFSLYPYHYLLPLILYCAFIIYPTAYILGQTVPLITKVMPKNEVGYTSGKVLFLSTIGSFLGAILTTNILLHFFGVSITLSINTILLLFLAYIINKNHKNILIYSIVIILVLAVNIIYENKKYIKTNAYSNYEVSSQKYENNELLIFKSNNSYSSIKIKGSNEKFGYIKEIQDFLFKDLKLKNKRILVIGAGGFLLSDSVKDNYFKYVDIDPDIIALAEKNFLFKNINGEFEAKDGRNYINYTKETYDVIFLDAFVSKKSIPEHLATREFLLNLKSRIKDDGWFVINSIQDSYFKESYSRNMYKTINNVFDYCYIKPLSIENDLTNVIYYCKKVNKDYLIYTDDKNSSNEDYFKLEK